MDEKLPTETPAEPSPDEETPLHQRIPKRALILTLFILLVVILGITISASTHRIARLAREKLAYDLLHPMPTPTPPPPTPIPFYEAKIPTEGWIEYSSGIRGERGRYTLRYPEDQLQRTMSSARMLGFDHGEQFTVLRTPDSRIGTRSGELAEGFQLSIGWVGKLDPGFYETHTEPVNLNGVIAYSSQAVDERHSRIEYIVPVPGHPTRMQEFMKILILVSVDNSEKEQELLRLGESIVATFTVIQTYPATAQ